MPKLTLLIATILSAALLFIPEAPINPLGLSKARAAPPRYPYALTVIGPIGGANSFALAVNDDGQVVGGSTLSHGDGTHVFIWKAGALHDLGTVGGRLFSIGTSVSDSGVVVGTGQGLQPYYSSGGIWKQGKGWTVFSTGLCQSDAYSTNARGVVGGDICHQESSTSQNRATLWQPANHWRPFKHTLLKTRRWFSSIQQVAGSGDLVGYEQDDSMTAHAMFWINHDKPVGLPPLNGPNSIANGLTESRSSTRVSAIAVGGSDWTDGNEHACFWRFEMSTDRSHLLSRPGGCHDVGSIVGYPSSELLAINSSGVAIGDVSANGTGRAVTWTARSGIVDLNSLIPPSDLELAQAAAISSNGQIAGFGVLPNGDERAFLLSPIKANVVPNTSGGVRQYDATTARVESEGTRFAQSVVQGYLRQHSEDD